MEVKKDVLIIVGIALFLIIVGSVIAFFSTPKQIEAPTLTVSLDGKKVLLSWQGEGDVFEVYRKEEGGVYEHIASVNVSGYVDEPGFGVFYYKVKAFKNNIESPFSNEVKVVIRPKKPVIYLVNDSFGGCLNKEKGTFYIEAENAEKCYYSFDGVDWVYFEGNKVELFVPEGISEVLFKCENKGVESDIVRYSFSVDRKPPSVVLENPIVEGSKLKGVLTTNEPVSCLLYYENGTLIDNVSFDGLYELDMQLPLGKYLVTISCYDSCGNEGLLYYEADNSYVNFTNNTNNSSEIFMRMVINGDDGYTYSRVVELNVETVGIDKCRFANEENYPDEWSDWYNANDGNWSVSWLLSRGYGRKTVYMQCEVGGEIVGETYDSIVYKKKGGSGSSPPSGGGATVEYFDVFGNKVEPDLPSGVLLRVLPSETIPLREVKYGSNDYVVDRNVEARFNAVGDEARLEVEVFNFKYNITDYDSSLLNGSYRFSLPPIYTLKPSDISYRVNYYVRSNNGEVVSSKNIVLDVKPPVFSNANVVVYKDRGPYKNVPNLEGYRVNVSGNAYDNVGIKGYVLVLCLKMGGKCEDKYMLYKEGSSIDLSLFIPTTGYSAWEAELHAFSNGGLHTVERFSGTFEEGGFEPLPIPKINNFYVVNSPSSMPPTEDDKVLGNKVDVWVDASNVRMCGVYITQGVMPSFLQMNLPYETNPQKYTLDVPFDREIESYGYVAVQCKKEPFITPIKFKRVLFDLAGPRISVYALGVNPIEVGTRKVEDISYTHVSSYTWAVEDVSFDRAEIYVIYGDGPDWSNSTTDIGDVTVRDVVLYDNSTRHYGRVDVFVNTTTYTKLRVVAYDSLGHRNVYETPLWQPSVSITPPTIPPIIPPNDLTDMSGGSVFEETR